MPPAPGSGPRSRGREPRAVPERMGAVYAAYRSAVAGDPAIPAGAAAAKKAGNEDSRVRAFLIWLDGPGRPGAGALADAASAAAAAGEYRADLAARNFAPETVSRHTTAAAALRDRLGLVRPQHAEPVRRGAAPAEVPDRHRQAYQDYERQLEQARSLLDADTRRAYASRVRQFLIWLDQAQEAGLVQGDPLAEQHAATFAARDYRAHLMTVRKNAAETVNAHLSALGDFYRRRQLQAPDAQRQTLPDTAPRALPPRERTLLQRAAERASERDRVLVYLGILAGLREEEVHALDVDDVSLSARLGMITVRYGKGGKSRQVPLHPKLRAALVAYLAVRRPADPQDKALILGRHGARLSTRGVYEALVKVAGEAGLVVGRAGHYTPHVGRHTAGTVLHRDLGIDLATVAEILGQSERTTRRYVKPTAQEKFDAVAAIPVDA